MTPPSTDVRLGSVIEMAPEALAVLDAAGAVVIANRAARELARSAPLLSSAMRGELPLRRMLFEHARFEDKVAEDPSSCDPVAMKCAFEAPPAGTLWILVKLTAIQEAGAPAAHTVCSLRDIGAERMPAAVRS